MDDLSHHGIGELSDVIRPLGSLEHLFWLADQKSPVPFCGDCASFWRNERERLA